MRGPTITRLLVLAVIAAIPVWFVFNIGWPIHVHNLNRERLQSPAVYTKVAEELALYCQSIDKTTEFRSSMEISSLPETIRSCKPLDGYVSQSRAHFEMHGGFDHYGYKLVLDDANCTENENVWELFYYSDGSADTKLLTLRMDRDKRSPAAGQIRSVADDGTSRTGAARIPRKGEDALCFAARDGNMARVHELLANGADINQKDRNGQTPLHHAAARSSLQLAGLFLEKGASVNAQDLFGETPLHVAARAGSLEIAHLLVSKGAKVDAQSIDLNTPLHNASEACHPEIVRYLADQGANVGAMTNMPLAPLHLAAAEGCKDIVEFLIERGADVNADKGEGTPLQWAVDSGQTEVAALLISKGADVHAKLKYGRLLLGAVAMHGQVDLARILIAAGVDVNARSQEGETCLSIAKHHKKQAMIELLRQHGAKD